MAKGCLCTRPWRCEFVRGSLIGRVYSTPSKLNLPRYVLFAGRRMGAPCMQGLTLSCSSFSKGRSTSLPSQEREIRLPPSLGLTPAVHFPLFKITVSFIANSFCETFYIDYTSLWVERSSIFRIFITECTINSQQTIVAENCTLQHDASSICIEQMKGSRRKLLRIKKQTQSGLLFYWSGLRGSNPPPPPWQGGALPNELNPHMVPPVGIEPTTRGFSVLCSTN